MRRWSTLRVVLAAIAVFALARGGLHLATFHLPLSTDDAVPMVQARLLWRGEAFTTLINQPYNGTLDTWLLLPLTLFVRDHEAFRLYQFLGAVALALLAARLAHRAAGREAAVATALAVALGTPYMGLMTTTGPVPNFLIPIVVSLTLLCLWGTEARPAGRARGFLAGLVAGLGTWNTVLTVPGLLGGLGGLAVARVPLLRHGLPFSAGFVFGYVPALLSRAIGAAGPSPSASVQPYSMRGASHWGEGAATLAHAVTGLFGLQVPLVIDGPERASLPLPVVVLLASSLIALMTVGVSRSAAPFLGWAAALSAAFALSGRTEPHDVRYLYGLTVPGFVLLASGFTRLLRGRAWLAAVLAVAVAGAWAAGHRIVLHHWRSPEHAARVWGVADLGPTLDALARLGARSAYASLQFACRLTLESDGRLVSSQAWNERMPGDPLRFRDEVDLDPQAVWMLSTWLSRGMPRAAGFREQLAGMGGRWREDTVGDGVIFYGFTPPFDEGRPVPAQEISVQDEAGRALPASALDRNVETGWRAAEGLHRGAGLHVRVAPARRLSAVVLGIGIEGSPLGVTWVATVDGEVVARGPRRFALQWVGGVPRAAKQALLTIVLPERRTGEVRLLFQEAGPALWVSEVFAYGPDEAAREAAGAGAAALAYEHVRAGRWEEAAGLYAEAARLSPDRATYHASLVRARWRAAHRRHLDVESLDDGGAEVLNLRK